MSIFRFSKRFLKNNEMYLLLSIVSYSIYIILIGGDHMPGFRLFAPIIPLTSLLLYFYAKLFFSRIIKKSSQSSSYILFSYYNLATYMALDRDVF